MGEGKLEEGEEIPEALSGLGAEAGQRAHHLFPGFLLHIPGFGEELVRQADQFFLRGFRQKILGWERQSLTEDLLPGESRPGMAFADPGQGFHLREASMLPPPLAQHLAAQEPVAQIRFLPQAEDARGMAAPHPHVMQEGAVSHQGEIQRDAGGGRQSQGLLLYLETVTEKKPPERRILRIEVPEKRIGVVSLASHGKGRGKNRKRGLAGSLSS